MTKEPNQASICGWFGISRQAHVRKRKREEEAAALKESILEGVREIRQRHPRMGARKLLDRLQRFLGGKGIEISRDKFFDLLREEGMLVPHRRKGTRTTFHASR